MNTDVFLGALFGALLGFLGGVGVDALVMWWQRRERRRRYRSLIANDLILNLSALARMEVSTQATKEHGYAPAAEVVIDTPRVDLLRSIVGATEALLPLTPLEQHHAVEAAARLERLLREYAGWPRNVTGVAGMVELRLPDGSTILQRDAATTQLLRTIEDVMVVHISMLVHVLNNSGEKHLVGPIQQSLRKALAPTRKRWPLFGKFNWTCAVRVPPPQSQTSKPLVVWSRDNQSYPAPVIELAPILGDG